MVSELHYAYHNLTFFPVSFSYRILCVSNVSIPSRRRMAAKQTSNIEISPSTMAITAADHVKPIDVSVIHLNNVKH